MDFTTYPLAPAPNASRSPGRENGHAPPFEHTAEGEDVSYVIIHHQHLFAQGSVVSSEMSNVKLESGTFMLLRVNP